MAKSAILKKIIIFAIIESMIIEVVIIIYIYDKQNVK